MSNVLSYYMSYVLYDCIGASEYAVCFASFKTRMSVIHAAK